MPTDKPIEAMPRIRAIEPRDRAAWELLWAAYNAFYGRVGNTALPAAVTHTTWERFFNPAAPIHGLVAEAHGRVVGITHYLFHPSTSRPEGVCYLQDLFTEPSQRGCGIGRALILAVYERAKARGVKRVYWQTQESNAAGRALYDKLATFGGFIVYGHDV
jgi:GNAT superfamily N-acetyltransferase